MAFSCGFYNSLNGDRKYNTRQISEIFDGIIKDGVYMTIGEKLTVKEGTGMQISVGTGRAWFNHTWSLVDADLPLTVDQSDLVLDRIDAVVLEVNESNETRDNIIKVVKGTAASSPSKPEMSNTEFIHQYPLAYITVKKGVTSITTSDIEINVGKDNCPYVTSVLEAVSIEELYAQWESQFSDWEEGQKMQFEAWFAMIKGQLSEDAAGNLQVQIDDKGIQVYTHSKSGSVHEFTGSGPNGRALLTADIEEGDTFNVNGSPVTAYIGSENAVDVMMGANWNGKWVTFVYDGDAINFKGGGGLSAADRAKLIPQNLRKDVVLFAGTPREVVGSLTWQDLFPATMVVQNKSVIDEFIGGGITASHGPIYVDTEGIRCYTYDVVHGFRFNLPIDSSLFSTVRFSWTGADTYRNGAFISFGVGGQTLNDSDWDAQVKYFHQNHVPPSGMVDVTIPDNGRKLYIKSILAGGTYYVTKTELIKRE